MFVNIVLLSVGLLMLIGNLFSLRFLLMPPIRRVDIMVLIGNLTMLALYWIAVGAVITGVN